MSNKDNKQIVINLPNWFAKKDPKAPVLTYAMRYANPVRVSAEKKGLLWDFDMRKIKTKFDLILLIGMVKDQPLRGFLIPADHVKNLRHIRVSVKGASKWYAYKIW